MKKIAVSAAVLLLSAQGAVSWDRTFGSDLPEQAFFSLVTEDGGMLTCGVFIIDVSYSIVSSEGAGGVDCMLVRTDSEGNTLWEGDYYSGPWPDLAVAGIQSDDGCFVLAGVTTTMEEGQQNWIFKVADGGEVLWESSPGTDFDDWTYDMTMTSEGSFIIAGYVDSLSGEGPVISLLKIDGEGEELWSRQYGRYGTGMAEAVFERDDGHLMVCGNVEIQETGLSVPFLMSAGPGGDPDWFATFDSTEGNCYSLDMSAVNDGTIMLAGYVETAMGDYDVWIGRMTMNGEPAGEWSFGGEKDDMAFSTAPCPRGMVVAGSTDSDPAKRSDLLLMGVSPEGELLWSATHGGPGNEGAENIEPLPSGGFVVSGYTSSRGAGDTDIWVLEVDCSGEPAD
ncbi:MAG: hypothetical protein JXR55_11260 [Candidatus Fermentibacteraceae bacterium]|nr:hypothetical protein [Candidatus Fermentibacteraceae bacterium]